MKNGTCTGSGSNPDGYGYAFRSVTLNKFSRSSTCWGSSDSDAYRYWNDSTELIKGKQYILKVKAPMPYLTNDIVALGFWIDDDKNYQFDSAELIFSELVPRYTNTVLDKEFLVNIPCNAATGSSRLRIRIQPSVKIWGADTCKLPYGLGETWDFNVIVKDPPVPVADFTVDTPIWTKNSVVLQCTDKNGNEYAWDVDNDATIDQIGALSSIRIAQYRWSTPGSKCVGLRVTNCAGSDAILKCVQVTAPGAVPVPDFNSNYKVIQQYESIQVFDESTNGPWEWHWQVYDSVTNISNGFIPSLNTGEVYSDPWGRGNDEYSKNPEFAFDFPGCYTIRMSCKNDMGSSVEKVKLCHVLVLDPNDTSKGVYGHIYQDLNSNCMYNSGDSILKNIMMNVLDSSGSRIGKLYLYDGDYHLNLDSGKYTLELDTIGKAFTFDCKYPGIDSSFELNTFKRLIRDVDFSVKCRDKYDIEIPNMRVAGRVFPGRDHILFSGIQVGGMIHGLECQNAISGFVRIKVSGKLSYIAPVSGGKSPYSSSGNVFTYAVSDFTDLDSFRDFGLEFKVDTSATALDSIKVWVDLFTNSPDLDTNNNHIYYWYPVRNSYDPNFKEVYPEAVEPGFQNWLVYTVHFQNTGNAAAENIRLEDTLSDLLNPETFEILESSHQMNAELKKNIVNFRFPDIMLPDSNSNEPASHGFVQYRVKPKAPMGLSDRIRNTAYIYFDYNPYVQTNTALTEVHEESSIYNANYQSSVSIYPNPGSGKYTLSYRMGSIQKDAELEVFNSVGILVLKQKVRDGKNEISLSGLSDGIYLFRVNDGQNVHGFRVLNVHAD